jgi:hypothetical protein
MSQVPKIFAVSPNSAKEDSDLRDNTILKMAGIARFRCSKNMKLRSARSRALLSTQQQPPPDDGAAFGVISTIDG